MWRCHYCDHSISPAVQRKNRLCPNCNSDLHACRNCVHFEEASGDKCREPNSPWVRDRSATNHCPYFEFRQATSQPGEMDDARRIEAERAKEAFRALFRNP